MRLLLGIFMVLSIACSDIASYALMIYGIDSSSVIEQPQESEKESKKEESSEDSKIEISSSATKSGIDDLNANSKNFNNQLLIPGALYQELTNPPPELT